MPNFGSRYALQSLLGSGGMASVYLCRDRQLDRLVAVKVTPLASEFAAALERESRIWAGLNHPHIAGVYDFFRDGASSYLVLEYVPGRPLEALRGSPQPQARVLDIAEQLLSALGYLHGQHPPVFFRDLTPRNVMLQDDGRVKLIDFGIAKLGNETVTRTVVRGMGSSGYAPLEQYSGRGNTDARSDLYGLGAVLLFLLTGDDPPDAADRLQGPLDPLDRALAGQPPGLGKLIGALMALRQCDRPASAREVWPLASAPTTIRRVPTRQPNRVPVADPGPAWVPQTFTAAPRRPGAWVLWLVVAVLVIDFVLVPCMLVSFWTFRG